MRAAVLVISALLCSTAYADEGCAFVSDSGWRAVNPDPGGVAMQIISPEGVVQHCWLTNIEPNIGDTADVMCGSDPIGTPVRFSGDYDSAFDTMQFRGQTFYLTCWGARA
jgi:hypothetical protein